MLKKLYLQLKPYGLLMRINRPVGTLLLLFPTLAALWVASSGVPAVSLIVIFVLGVFLMRSAGCIVNDCFDQRFDAHVARTRNRPLVSGLVNLRLAWLLFFVLVLFAFLLVLMLDALTIILSCVAIVLAVMYPLAKRHTYFPQVVLAIVWSFGILMAYSAVLHTIPPAAWCLFLANIFWTIAYDTQYAMVDRDDDVLIGVKSTAVFFGRYDYLFIACLHVLTLITLIEFARLVSLSFLFYWFLGVVLGLFVFQSWLLSRRNTKSYFRAFLNNQYVGGLLFFAVIFSSG